MLEQTVLLVGGPDSGKTNYLGRLWLAIRDHIGKLEVDGTPNDLEYLNQITRYFLQGQFAPHTPHEVQNKVVIPVKSSDQPTNFKKSLVVPDVSGEEWNNIYRKRGWSDEWEQMSSSVESCLVFVRVESDANVVAIDWIAWSPFLQNPPINDVDIPTQVVLVDWLQCLSNVFAERGSTFRPRIGVIVAAYDLLPNEQKELGPDAYLRSNFPLFWQYIHSMESQFDIRVFGTSIASGDFNADPDFRARFLDSNPGDAGYVIYHSKVEVVESKDITLPIVWALGLPTDFEN